MNKKGSWLSRSRSAQRLVKQRSLTKVVTLQRVSSITSLKKLRKTKKAAAEDEARDVEDSQNRSGIDYCERHPPSPYELHDGDKNDDDDEDDETYLNQPSGIYSDSSIYSLAPIEKDFIANTIYKLHARGYRDQMGMYSIGMILKEICALEKPFDSYFYAKEEYLDDSTRSLPMLDIEPVWARLEHSLSLSETSENNLALAEVPVKQIICSVLQEMNIKLVKGSSSKKSNGSWGHPPFSSWNSLTYCQCSLF